MVRPELEKVPNFYRGYVRMVPEEKELMPAFIESRDEFLELVAMIPEKKEAFSYDEGKWTIKELIQHICDAERVFSYRALRFGRGDMTDLAGFEQDDYVKNCHANQRVMSDLVREFTNTRNSTIDLYDSFDAKDLNRFGSASGFRIDVTQLGYIIVGHQLHHMAVLRSKYLS
ncbi:MAG: DinB family protein [Bacteroidota bacterium]